MARSPLPENQRPALFVQADIGTELGASEVIERVMKGWEGIDILINSVADRMHQTAVFRRSRIRIGFER